jgi:surface antigen
MRSQAALLRRLGPAIAALLGVSMLVVAPATASQPPDPCSVVTAGAVNAAFGAFPDTPEFGTEGSNKSHGMTAKTCTWTYASAKLVVSVAPKAFKPASWPAGTVSHKASGLGAGGKLATNNKPGYAFVAVTFTKGAYWGEVWVVNGAGGTASVLKVARQAYAKL